ncbi:hypothetical protein BJV78DRAFT_1158228 [Lactifluus subvellereus]|nr:hypothetical protein BJV78DRAFT_1158228 [Lactifluus subvellereus]
MLKNLDYNINIDYTMDQGGLDINVYDQIVQAASEAATIALLRAMQSWAQHLSHSVPVPLDHPNSDAVESETGVLQPFESPCRKKRVPHANHDKLIDEAMCKFLERKGVLACKNYFPDEPGEQLVKAFEDHDVIGPDPNAPHVSLRWQETYYRRRKFHNLNSDRDPEVWKGVKLLLDALGTLGTSDNETDDNLEHPNPDAHFKTLYKNCTPLPGLPINFYNAKWLQKSPPYFQKQVGAEVPLPVLVPYEKDDS